MNNKYFAGIAFLLVLLAFPLSVKAETCPSIVLTANPSSSVLGSAPKTIQIGIDSGGLGSPLDPWADYKNATISVSPSTGTLNLSQPFVDLISSASDGFFNWDFNISSSGTYNFSVDVQNTTSACSKSASFTATAVIDPNPVVSITDLGELKANIDNTGFEVALNNTGLGNAINVVIKVQSDVFPEMIKTISNLTAGSTSVIPFTLNPIQCFNTHVQVDVEYKDESGDSKPAITTIDNFAVNGSDLVIDQFNISASSVTEGGQVTFSTAVNNTGQKPSTGFNVTFYKNAVSSANKIAEITSADSIGLLESNAVSTTWTSSGAGTHNIIAVTKSASGECNTTNSKSTKSLIVNSASVSNGGTTTDNTGTTPSNTASNNIISSTATPLPSIETTATVKIPSPPAIVEETQQTGAISAGETKAVTFAKSDNLNIQQISLILKNSLEGATVNVKKESEKPASVTVPAGEVHSFLTITTSVKNTDISSAKVAFKIEKSWLSSKSIDKNKVSLNRFTSQWDKLPTAFLSEDDNFVYYSADTPGFSVFSVIGEPTIQSSSQPAVSGAGGPSGLFLGGQSNLVILGIMVVAAALIFFLYKRKGKSQL